MPPPSFPAHPTQGNPGSALFLAVFFAAAQTETPTLHSRPRCPELGKTELTGFRDAALLWGVPVSAPGPAGARLCGHRATGRRGPWPDPPCICRPAAGVSRGPSAQSDAAVDTHMQVFVGTGFLSLG